VKCASQIFHLLINILLKDLFFNKNILIRKNEASGFPIWLLNNAGTQKIGSNLVSSSNWLSASNCKRSSSLVLAPHPQTPIHQGWHAAL